MRHSLRGASRATVLTALMPGAFAIGAEVVPATARAQQPVAQPAGSGIITGRVTERASGAPVAAAQVRVVGTNRGALTGEDGRFRIVGVPVGTVQVQARRLGYGATAQPVTVAAGATVTADFTVTRAEAQALEQVVVTATGAEQAARETGNQVARITPSAQPLPAITSGSQLLEAKAAGVLVTQSGGASGAGARVRIRGGNSLSLSNEPLLIIDGVRVSSDPRSTSIDVGGQEPSRINDLKPEDIESIEILKGPAATGLYGTQAANGVIQVTTRRGVRGRTQYNVFAEGGALQNPFDFELNTRAFGPTEDGEVNNYCDLAAVATGGCVRQDSLQTFQPLNDPRTTPFRTGSRQRYGVSASGGGELATYYLSGDYEDEKGIYRNNGIRRINLRSNATAQLRPNLDITANVGYLNLNNPRPQNDNNDQGYIGGGLLGSTEFDAERQGYLRAGPSVLEGIETRQTGDRLIGAGSINYRPLSWLTFVGQSGVDIFNRDDQNLVPFGLLELFDPDRAQGQRLRNKYRLATFTANGSGIATRTFAGVQSTSTVGVQFQRDRTDGTDASGFNILPGTGGLGTTNSRFAIGEDAFETRLFGMLAQQQFSYRDRYYVTAAVRGDNNSAFGQDVGFVTYPSANASWVVSEEGFFPKSSLLGSFRLRGAVGRSGQRPTQLSALRYFTPVAVTTRTGDEPGFTIGNLGNTRLRPEVTTEGEIGFDATALNARATLEVTYFSRRTNDQLVNVPLAPSIGTGPDAPSRTQNIGTVTNKGLELSLTTSLIRRPNLGFDVTWNFATLANKIVTLRDTTPIVFGTQRHTIGRPAGSYFQVPYTFADGDRDGVITADEITIQNDGNPRFIGNPLPRRTLAVQPVITAGPNGLVRLQATVDYRGGWYQENTTQSFRCQFLICPELYRPGSPLDKQARGVATSNYGTDFGYIEKADFVKLREVAATVQLPRVLLLGRARNGALTLAGRNLFISSKYSGLDPEANAGAQLNWSQFDFLSQPPVRLFSARLSFNY